MFLNLMLSLLFSYEVNTYQIGLRPMLINMVDRITTSDDASEDFKGTLYYNLYEPIHLAYTFQINPEWYLSPYLNYTFTGLESEDGLTTNRICIIGFEFGKNLQNQMDWNLSTGVFMQTIEGNGGLYTDPNGSTFYSPSGEETSKDIILGLGLGKNYTNFRWAVDLFVTDFLNNDSRTFNLAFTFSYLGGK